MRKAVLAMAFLVLAPGLGLAQTPGDSWQNLRQLRVGQKIKVVDVNHKKVKGRFIGVSEDALALRVNGKPVAIGRGEIILVSVGPSSRLKQILLGVLAGALVGASAWMEADRAERGCWEDSSYCERETGLSGRSAVISTAMGAGALGLVAAFTGKGDQPVYIRPLEAVHDEAPTDASLQPEKAADLEPADSSPPEGNLDTKEPTEPESPPATD